MTMYTQVHSGLTAAIAAAAAGEAGMESRLSALTPSDREHIVDHVLAALADAPNDTPAPQMTVVAAATPMLVLSPADVVARSAQDALDEVRATHGSDQAPITDEVWAAGQNRRAFREFLFRIQHMFGVRVRSILDDADPWFRVAGTRDQIRAFKQVVTMIRDAADADVVADMSAEDQKVFYATLGTLIASHDDAEHLIESNRALFAAASEYLNHEYGPTRNLRRATPATDGDIYAAAAQVAPVRLPVEPGTMRPAL